MINVGGARIENTHVEIINMQRHRYGVRAQHRARSLETLNRSGLKTRGFPPLSEMVQRRALRAGQTTKSRHFAPVLVCWQHITGYDSADLSALCEGDP